MARKLLALTAPAASLVLALLAGDARAGATVDLLFVGINGLAIAATDTVNASAGDVLEMAVVMRNDEPLTAASYSLNYDLDGDNELDVLGAFLWRGVALNKSGTMGFVPISPLSPVTATFVGSFQGFSNFVLAPLPPAGGAFAGGYQMGTVFWGVNAGVNNDGADILSGLFKVAIDAFGDAFFNEIDSLVAFHGATANLIPEPGTAALLGLGLATLARGSRRARRP